MKLLKKINRNKFLLNMRNSFGFERMPINIFDTKNNTSISDAFPWRTDFGFKTKFKFTDILKVLFSINESIIELKFYNNNFIELKSLILKNFDISDEINITKEFLSYEGYGIFFIFHRTKKKVNTNSIISNRCYTGFSYKNDIYSYVHGNTLVLGKNINLKISKNKKDFVQKTLFVNQNYFIQNDFSDSKKIELFFINPTSKKINVIINEKNNFFLLGYNSKILSFDDKKTIYKIRSNCTFLRPLVFNYKGKFFDVHHS